MEKPLVSIFTITRNRSDLLPRAMRSILNQTYENIEYIIIDSASTDGTEAVVKSFKDNRIRYVKLEQNESFGHCINMAFQLSTGKYVTELDDDDEYCIDKIEKQVLLFETLPIDYGMVYCWMTYYDNITKEELYVHKAELRGNVISEAIEKPVVSGTPTLLVRKSIFEGIGGYKEADEIGIESDWEFCCRICNSYKVDFVPESLVKVYVNHGHQRMSEIGYYADKFERDIVFHKYFLNLYKDVFKLYPKKQIPHLEKLVRAFFGLKRPIQGFKYYLRLITLRPSLHNLLLPPYMYFKKVKH